ncbi:hypothetical protein Tco_1194485 [Tanacetum coccineum]
MTTLKFADTHNMVAFLSKPAESEGFEQIVDFLNAHPIKNALTLQALVDGKKIIITESTVRRYLQLEDAEGVDCLPNATIFEQLTLMGYEQSGGPIDNVVDEAVNEEMDDSLERAITTATSLDTEQDKGNINKTQSKATPNEPSSPRTSLGSSPRCQETMGDTIGQTRSENVSKLSNNLLLARVLALETTKTTQYIEIASLKRRVKKLERRNKSRTYRLKRLYKVGSSRRVESSDEEGLGEEDASKQGRIADIDADAGITLDSTHFDADTDMLGVHDLDGDEVIVDNKDVVTAAEETRSVVEEVTAVTIPVSATTTTTTTTIITDVEMTLAQALADFKSAKPKADKVVIQEPEQGTTMLTLIITNAAITITTVSTRPRAKGIVIHEQEQAPTPTISSQQPSQEVQNKGNGKMVEPEPVKKMSKKDLLWLDEELAFKLQAKEEEEEEEMLAREKAQQVEEANIAWDDQRRKHFAAKRAKEKRNRPPTRAQQRSIMCTYLKNIEGWKPKSLKNKSFANIQELFDKAMKRVNTFVDYRTELVEESSKKAEAEISHESNDRDDVTIDVIPLSTKSPTIVDYKIYKKGKKNYFQIIRADGNSQIYLTFRKILKRFDKEDLEVLWSIVKARFKKTWQVNYMDNFLLLKLKTMFEHHVKDNVWKNQQGFVKVLNYKLYDSCGVHCVTMQSMLFYLLVEKMYLLINHTLHQMFNDVNLQVDYECEMEFELFRLVKKQLKEGCVPE